MSSLPRREGGEVVEQPVDQRRLDLEAANGGRPGDRVAHLLAAHARREIEALVDRLGEAVDQRRRAEIFGAHGDRDVDARFAERRARAFKQQRDEGLRLLPLGIVAVAEQLLELVDEEEQVGAFAADCPRAPFDDRARPAREEGAEKLDLLLVGLLGRVRRGRAEQRLREVVDRPVAGPEIGDQPARAGLVQKPDLERVEQAGLDQRGFAAARGAEHGEEARRRQPVDHIVDAALAAEEEVGLFAREGAQPRIGQSLPGRAH